MAEENAGTETGQDTTLDQTATNQEESQGNPQGTSAPHGDGIDWKAEARKWERIAKGNKDAVEQLGKLQAEAATTQGELEQARGQIEAKDAEISRIKAINAVAEAKGVPAALLQGETEEELEQSADALLKFAESTRPAIPQDKGGSPAGATATIDLAKIKDPVERLNARIALNRANGKD